MNQINRKILGTVCLMIATFLNPFGFDILVYKLTQLTNDYWYSMVVLYFLVGLFFGLSYLLFKLGKRTLGNVAISIALFLNPFGYDLVVYGINYLTNDYWVTMGIMYILAGTFFGLFMYLYRINPIKKVKEKLNGRKF
jgi:H+/Cl- antiporter ClcA